MSRNPYQDVWEQREYLDYLVTIPATGTMSDEVLWRNLAVYYSLRHKLPDHGVGTRWG